MFGIVISQIEIFFFALKTLAFIEALRVNVSANWDQVILYLGNAGILEEITVKGWQLMELQAADLLFSRSHFDVLFGGGEDICLYKKHLVNLLGTVITPIITVYLKLSNSLIRQDNLYVKSGQIQQKTLAGIAVVRL